MSDTKQTQQEQITIEIDAVTKFGTMFYYPHCKIAKGFANLLKQTSLTRRNLDDIKKMGFVVKTLASEATYL